MFQPYVPIDIYMENGQEIVGLHFIGWGPDTYEVVDLDGKTKTVHAEYRVLEAWGNNYDRQGKMVGLGSFRIHCNDNKDIDMLVEDFKKEGFWVTIKPGIIAQDHVELGVVE